MITRDKAMQIALQAGNGVDLEKLLPFDGFIERFYTLARADQTEVIRQLGEALQGFMYGAEAMGWNTEKASAALLAAKPYMER